MLKARHSEWNQQDPQLQVWPLRPGSAWDAVREVQEGIPTTMGFRPGYDVSPAGGPFRPSVAHRMVVIVALLGTGNTSLG